MASTRRIDVCLNSKLTIDVFRPRVVLCANTWLVEHNLLYGVVIFNWQFPGGEVRGNTSWIFVIDGSCQTLWRGDVGWNVRARGVQLTRTLLNLLRSSEIPSCQVLVKWNVNTLIFILQISCFCANCSPVAAYNDSFLHTEFQDFACWVCWRASPRMRRTTVGQGGWRPRHMCRCGVLECGFGHFCFLVATDSVPFI